MIFESKIFELKEKNNYIKSTMNGLDEPTLEDFQFLSSSPALIDDCRREGAKEEYILSYVEAAKVIVSYKKNLPIKVFIGKYSLAIPCIYLCRHALELCIKDGIDKMQGEYDYNHNLHKLWEIFKEMINRQYIDSLEEEIIESMGSFVDFISELDDSGTKLRYPENKEQLSQEKLIFVNLREIVETTERFIKQMRLLINESA